MTDFNIGDRVIATRAEHSDNVGKAGVITGFTNDGWGVKNTPIVQLDNGNEVYLSSYKLDLEHQIQDTPALPTNVYFIVTTERGQFRSADYDLNDPEASEAVWEIVENYESDEGLSFVSSTDTFVIVPRGKIDNIVWHNLPTE